MVRADHPLAKRSSIRLAECAPYALVMPEYGTRAREVYDEILGKAGINPRSVVSTTSYAMLRGLANAGLGAAIVSDYLVRPNRSPNVVFVPIREFPPQVVACCTRVGRDLSVVATEFVDRLRQVFASLGRPRRASK